MGVKFVEIGLLPAFPLQRIFVWSWNKKIVIYSKHACVCVLSRFLVCLWKQKCSLSIADGDHQLFTHYLKLCNFLVANAVKIFLISRARNIYYRVFFPSNRKQYFPWFTIRRKSKIVFCLIRREKQRQTPHGLQNSETFLLGSPFPIRPFFVVVSY